MERELPAEGEWNEVDKAYTIRVTDNWIVQVAPMIFNDRIVLCTLSEYRLGYTAGFCYDKGGAAHLAALAWDPEEEGDPLGYKKIAYDGRKRR